MTVLGFLCDKGDSEDVVLWRGDFRNLVERKGTSAGHQG